MKKLLIMLTCLLLTVSAFGQWEAVRGPVVYDSYTDAVAMNSLTILTVNDNLVQRTVDFGSTWTSTVLPTASNANDMDSEDSVAVIVFDGGYIYKTTDNGANWMQIGDTAQFTTDLHQVDVFDVNTYFVSGEDGLFMKTSDGGTNWDTTVVDVNFDIDAGIAFTSTLNGVALQDGNDARYWRTTDGGDTWTELTFTWPAYLQVSKRQYDVAAAAGTNTIVAVGYSNTIWLSTDGGATFAITGDYSFGYDYNEGVKLFGADSILVFSDDSDVFKTVNGGTSWETISTGSHEGYSTSAFSSMNNGIVFSGYGQVMSTTDGTTFAPVFDWPGLSFWGLLATEDGEVMVSSAGSGGEITYSPDGMDFPYPTNLATNIKEKVYELHETGGDTIVMGGNSGLIKISPDKGATWSEAIDNPMAQLTNKHINMMRYDNGKLFAGGSSGMIMVSTNNGETWTQLYNESTQIIHDMKILSNGLGLLCSVSGQISVSTSTALDSFVVSADAGNMVMRSVDERNGVVIVGSSENIFKTNINSLDTLIVAFEVPEGDDIYGVRFVNDTTVYAVGQDGRIFISQDAGDSWVDMPSEALINEIDLQNCAYDGKYIWAVGKNGLILKHEVTDKYIKADFVEEFTDGTPDLTWAENAAEANTGGMNLTVVADSAGLSNVGIYVNDAGNGLLYANTGEKLRSYEVSADIYIVKEQSATEALYKGLAVKTDPTVSKYYRFVYRNSSSDNGQLRLQGYSSAGFETLKYFSPGVDFDTLETGFHNFKVQVIENEFWAYIDGVLLPGCPYVSTTTGLKNGYPGVYNWAGTTEFDNFKVIVYDYAKYQVTANVNMSIQILKGNFADAGNNLDIMGSFNNWAEGIKMTDADGDSIYSAVLGEFEKDTELEFKCRRNGQWDGTQEYASGTNNRSYTVLGTGSQNIPVFYYDDVTEVAIDGVPGTFALEQNYPNPFNPATTVKFQIPNMEMVNISIFNVAGRKVAEVVNEQLEAGYYTINFNASVLPSGVYLYRITAGTFSDVKKMTLLK